MKDTYHIRLEDPPGLAILDIAGPDSTKELVLTRVNVPKAHRGKGYARQLLKQALDDADREGVTLLLGAVPSDGLNMKQLMEWYSRHGFTVFDDNVMMRLPCTSARSECANEQTADEIRC